MNTFCKVFEIEDTQLVALKTWGDEEETFDINCITQIGGCEGSLALSYTDEELWEKKFEQFGQEQADMVYHMIKQGLGEE